MRTLNLGILAHVDAGKTTLTERLLFEAGAIRKLGTVDDGTTQTDSLELERERGITIKSAVASFAIGDLTVNILDTPGHPDFIAEVERVLRVLDGAILVISAVEGVQPQTPLLYRALDRLGVPTLFFLNKLDRAGADPGRVVDAIRARLTPDVIAMADPEAPEHRAAVAERLAEHDEALLAAYVDGPIPWPRLRAGLVEQTRRGLVHPAFAGAAATGEGVGEILRALSELLPEARGNPSAEAEGRVFKIERSATGERVAYVRLSNGTVRTRERLTYGEGLDGRVTSMAVYGANGAVPAHEASAGQIAKLGGLSGIRVGDRIGSAGGTPEEGQFPPPALESVVSPRRAQDRGRLRAALNELAEQDPLINVRQDDELGEIAVSLYGEVQKEVVGETLARDYGVAVDFAPTTTICIERPTGLAEVLEVISSPSKANISGKSSPDSTNPYAATIGLRLEPGKPGSGLRFEVDVDVQVVPMYVFNTVASFRDHMARYVADALAEGGFGWQVTDCVVTLFDSGYVRTGSTAGDFRKLTAVVLARAVEQAGTVVCEPMTAVRVEGPPDAARRVVPVLLGTGARVLGQQSDDRGSMVAALVQSGRVHEVQARLPGLTGGEGIIETSFAGYHPVTAEPPPRRRGAGRRVSSPR